LNLQSSITPALGRASRLGLCYALGNIDERNKLYFGDNLKILRDYVADPAGRDGPDPAERCPPFNSSATGSLCVAPPFRAARAGLKPGATATGEESAAQIMAFEDAWLSRVSCGVV